MANISNTKRNYKSTAIGGIVMALVVMLAIDAASSYTYKRATRDHYIQHYEVELMYSDGSIEIFKDSLNERSFDSPTIQIRLYKGCVSCYNPQGIGRTHVLACDVRKLISSNVTVTTYNNDVVKPFYFLPFIFD